MPCRAPWHRDRARNKAARRVPCTARVLALMCIWGTAHVEAPTRADARRCERGAPARARHASLAAARGVGVRALLPASQGVGTPSSLAGEVLRLRAAPPPRRQCHPAALLCVRPSLRPSTAATTAAVAASVDRRSRSRCLLQARCCPGQSHPLCHAERCCGWVRGLACGAGGVPSAAARAADFGRALARPALAAATAANAAARVAGGPRHRRPRRPAAVATRSAGHTGRAPRALCAQLRVRDGQGRGREGWPCARQSGH